MRSVGGLWCVGGFVPLGVLAWAVAVNPLFLDRPLLGFFLWAVSSAFCSALLWLGRNVLPVPQHQYRWIALQLLVYAFLCLRPSPKPVEAKLLIVGIDGAHWSLVDRFEMTALQDLRQKSISGPLLAEEPLFSPLLWTTIATGKRPAEHGIRGFRTQSTDAQSARFWEIADANGLSIGLYKWLVTWPPTPFQSGGFVVPAWLSPSPETWPAELSVVKEIELSRRLRRRNIAAQRTTVELAIAGIPLGFRLSSLVDALQLSLQQKWFRPPAEEMAWAQQLLRIQLDRDVFVQQLHQHSPDVAAITLYATDALGHTHWKWLDCVDNCPPYANAVPEAYQQADAVLKELRAHVSPETAILVLSDHGFRAANSSDAAQRFQPKTEALRSVLQGRFPKLDVAKLGQKMVVSLPMDTEAAKLSELMGALDDFVLSETGEALYQTERLPNAPTSIGVSLRISQVDETQLELWRVGEHRLKDFVSLQAPFSGAHDSEGIFAFYQAGMTPQNLAIQQIDILPTLLAALKLKPAADLTGQSLLDNPLEPLPTYDFLRTVGDAPPEADVNTDFLKQLGYIE